MPFTDPWSIPLPDGVWPVGVAPFATPGDSMWWHSRRRGFEHDGLETIRPMRVVRDDEDGLILWLAPGTEIIDFAVPGYASCHDVPFDIRFAAPGRRPPHVMVRRSWQGAGVLAAVVPDAALSAWLFWGDSGFVGWYLNLENIHRRSSNALFTSDHTLDVWIDGHGAVTMKDADELDGAVAHGSITPDQASRIRSNGELAVSWAAARPWPLEAEWTTWQPDPSWDPATLPD